MTIDVIMPKLGITMEEGMISKWYKKEGQKIVKGEHILQVESDKALIEIEATHSGILHKIYRIEDETVLVGEIYVQTIP